VAARVPDQPASSFVYGRVLGPDGKPIRVFNVRLGLTRPSEPGQAYEVHYGEPGALFTSEDGAFVLTAEASPGQSARVVASAEGYRDAVVERAEFQPMAASRTAEAFDLRLGKPVPLTIRVVEARALNRPVKGARVTLDTPYWDPTRDGLLLDRVLTSPARPRQACTDASGNAVLNDVVFVDGVVRAECNGYALNGAVWDGRAQAVTVELEPECVLQGEVLAEDGRAPAQGEGLVVLKGSLDGSFDQNEAGAVFREHCIYPEHGGKFRVTGLPPRKYTLDITWRDGKATQAGFAGESAEQPVVVTSKAGGSLVGVQERPKQREFSDKFDLEAGETLNVSYPRDDVRLHPERIAGQEAEAPADAALHRGLVGVWERPWIDPNGAQVCEIVCFGEDSKVWTGEFVSPVPAVNRPGYVQILSGSFSVVGGEVHFYDERGHSWWPAPVEVQADRLGGIGRVYTRNGQGLEQAIRKAQAVCGVSMQRDLLPTSELGL
jgi:hypothetical protein